VKKLLFLLVVLANLLHAEDAPCFDPIGKLDWDFFIDNIELKFESCSCEIPDAPASMKAGFVMKIAEPIAMIEITDYNAPKNPNNFSTIHL